MHRTIRAIATAVSLALVATAFAAPAHGASSDVSLSRILNGYSRPLLVTHAPGAGRTIFIVEQTGVIKRATYRDGGWVKLGTFLDLSGRVNDPSVDGGERGLLGLAFHPDYQINDRFYVAYTRDASGDRKGDLVIAEFRRQSYKRADPSSQRVLMVVGQPATNHNGAHLAFGPDGLLYISTGDGGGAGDPQGSGQNLKTRLGKILRIDPLDPDGAGPRRYRTPSSNPRVGRKGNDDIWSWGLRNPWRFSFDRKNGSLWIGDVGQGAREEVDRALARSNGRGAGKGVNYGWNRCEGKRRYPNTAAACTFGTLPVHQYSHGAGRCSVTGGYVHRGPSALAWRGLYVAGDFCGRIFVLNSKGKLKFSKLTDRRISSFGEDAAGRIFLTDVVNGAVYRVKLKGPRP